MMLATELNDLEDMIIRREEWMAVQQLVNGYVDVVGDGVNYRIDLLMDTDHKITLAGTNIWTDPLSNPDSDIGDAVGLISKDAGVSANVMLGNAMTMDVYVNHAKVQGKLNTRRIDLGMIKPEDMGEGVSYYGYTTVNGKQIDLYGYDNWYIDDDTGNELPMFADGQVVITSTRADFRRHYGAIKDKEAGYAAIPRFPKVWDIKDPAVDMLMVQSAPLPAAHQIDSIVSMKVF